MGLRDKNLWNLLELLIVPIGLAGGAILFSQAQRDTEIKIETERQRESAFQAYIDRIKDLVLEMHAPHVDTGENSEESSDIQEALGNIGAAYTKATLQQLDPKRKGMLLEFLYDTHLIGWIEPGGDWHVQKIFLGENADFSGLVVNARALRGVNLVLADLSKSRLIGLDLYEARLEGCNLSNSSFRGVLFSGAEMSGANLYNARMVNRVYLEKATLVNANLKQADLRKVFWDGVNLEGAKYNAKTKFPNGFDPAKAKMVFEK